MDTSKVLSLLKDPYLKTRAKCRLKEKVLTYFNGLPKSGKKKMLLYLVRILNKSARFVQTERQ